MLWVGYSVSHNINVGAVIFWYEVKVSRARVTLNQVVKTSLHCKKGRELLLSVVLAIFSFFLGSYG